VIPAADKQQNCAYLVNGKSVHVFFFLSPMKCIPRKGEMSFSLSSPKLSSVCKVSTGNSNLKNEILYFRQFVTENGRKAGEGAGWDKLCALTRVQSVIPEFRV